MHKRRSVTVRRLHALIGVISAFNLLLLITTGLLLQHVNVLRLDERIVSRAMLPGNYRPQDGPEGVRADIVITDLHSGRILGPAGTVVLDLITLGWLVLLLSGLVMYTARNRAHARSRKLGRHARHRHHAASQGRRSSLEDEGAVALPAAVNEGVRYKEKG